MSFLGSLFGTGEGNFFGGPRRRLRAGWRKFERLVSPLPGDFAAKKAPPKRPTSLPPTGKAAAKAPAGATSRAAAAQAAAAAAAGRAAVRAPATGGRSITLPASPPKSMQSAPPTRPAISMPPVPPKRSVPAISPRGPARGLAALRRGGLAGPLDLNPTDLASAGASQGDGTGIPANATDDFGVAANHMPAGKAWVSHDLFENLRDDQVWHFNIPGVGVVRAKHRLAWPAIDNTGALCLTWVKQEDGRYNGYGNPNPSNIYDNGFINTVWYNACPADASNPNIAQLVDGGNGRMYDKVYWYLGLDDLRWDEHSPQGPALKSINDPNVGGFQRRVTIPMIPGLSPGDLSGQWRFTLMPCDYWAAQDASQPASWFDPDRPIPVDMLSYYVAGLIPEEAKAQGMGFADFWNMVTQKAQEAGLVANYTGGFNYVRQFLGQPVGAPGGRGMLTVYEPDDLPKPGIGGSISLGIPAFGANDTTGDAGEPPATTGEAPALDNSAPFTSTSDGGGSMPSEANFAPDMTSDGGGYYSEPEVVDFSSGYSPPVPSGNDLPSAGESFDDLMAAQTGDDFDDGNGFNQPGNAFDSAQASPPTDFPDSFDTTDLVDDMGPSSGEDKFENDEGGDDMFTVDDF